jgi:hypothetical protein
LSGHFQSHKLDICPDTTGDRISLFGFSRGAFTARALAGMLFKVRYWGVVISEKLRTPIPGRTSPTWELATSLVRLPAVRG